MRRMVVIFLAFSTLALCQENEVAVQSSKSADGLEEWVTAHFDESIPYSDQKQTVHKTARLLLSNGYVLCKETKNEVVQEGAGVFRRMFPFAKGEILSYTLETDTDFHQTSKIKGDVTILGVLDREKAGCPPFEKEFPWFAREAPSTLKRTQETLKHLPMEKVFSQHVSVSYPVDSPDLLKGVNSSVVIRITPPYHACRVESEEFDLTGLGYFERAFGDDSTVYYDYGLLPDKIFKQASEVVADLAIVGVLDREKAKCLPYEEGFYTFRANSQSTGWVSKYRYISQDHPASDSGGWSNGEVTATAPPGYKYCTHKVQVNTKNGTNRFAPTKWSDTSFTLNYGVLSGSIFDHPASLGLTLYVKFIQDSAQDPLCTVRLAGHKPPGQGHQLAGDVWYWTPDDSVRPPF